MTKETMVQWEYALGEWVHCDVYTDDAVFIIVWREYRESCFGHRQQYGLIALEDADLDLDDGKLTIQTATDAMLKPFQEPPHASTP